MIYNEIENNYKINKFISGIDMSLFGAFEIDTVLTLKFEISRQTGVFDVKLLVYNDDTRSDIMQPLNFFDMVNGYDIYTTDLKLSESALLIYRIQYNSGRGIKYTAPCQLTVYDKNFTTPDWIKGGIIYQIFVDRFCKSGKPITPKPNTIINNDWNGVPKYPDKPGDPIDNNDFFGGDLYGAANKLEYIKSLGCNCVYLNPIFEAHTNHKYDTGDFKKIDSMFGGDTAFDYFMNEAKKLNIHVILDGVFSHTGADSRYFNKFGTYRTKGAYQSRGSRYYKWFRFIDYPDKYKCWWDVDILPKVDDSNEMYREFICGENGIIRKYIKKGISGWRLDVVDELSNEFVEEIRKAAKSENQQSIIIGEVWENASNKIAYEKRRKYFRGNQLDSVMNYPLRDAIIKFVKTGDSEILYKTSVTIYENYPKQVCDSLMNILGTHDTERILSLFGSDKHMGRSNDELSYIRLTDYEYKFAIRKMKIAYLICATMYGVPCIYYGDEAGMQGYRDPFNRLCYPWGNEESALISWYKQIGQIRHDNADFIDGVFKVLEFGEGYIKYSRNDTVITIDASKMTGTISKNGEIILDSTYSSK